MLDISPENLLTISAIELMEKIGAGESTPGSGSIAALTGISSAQALISVIKLTDREKYRLKYAHSLPALRKMQLEIDKRIVPQLINLFQQDTDEFKKFNDLRIARDKELSIVKRQTIEEQLKNANKVIVQIPIEISKLCLTLAEYSEYAFKNGFQSVRGESSAAFCNAFSAASTSISIVHLNLKTCENSIWKSDTKKYVKSIETALKKYSTVSFDQIAILQKEVNDIDERNEAYDRAINSFRSNYWCNKSMQDNDIEILARDLQNALWTNRKKIWRKEIPEHPKDVLNPKIALERILGYNVIFSQSLGTNFVNEIDYKIAGIIDKRSRVVELSEEFSVETMIFTAAHELGHALLHNQSIQHRDRPVDGSLKNQRNKQEYQADKFAVFFLMPEKLVRAAFTELFGIVKIRVNQNTVFGLTNTAKVDDFKKLCEDLYGFACIIASTESYGGRQFNSLASVFNVSIKTMGLRLIELDLIEF